MLGKYAESDSCHPRVKRLKRPFECLFGGQKLMPDKCLGEGRRERCRRASSGAALDRRSNLCAKFERGCHGVILGVTVVRVRVRLVICWRGLADPYRVQQLLGPRPVALVLCPCVVYLDLVPRKR